MCAPPWAVESKTANAPASRAAAIEQKPKIDLSNISRPGDVLRAIQQQKEQRESHRRTPIVAVTQAPQRPTVTAAAAGPEAERFRACRHCASFHAIIRVRRHAGAADICSLRVCQRRRQVRSRRLVKSSRQPRQAPPIVVAPTATRPLLPAPPYGPVIVKPPSQGSMGASTVVAAPQKVRRTKQNLATPAASIVTPARHGLRKLRPRRVETPPHICRICRQNSRCCHFDSRAGDAIPPEVSGRFH